MKYLFMGSGQCEVVYTYFWLTKNVMLVRVVRYTGLEVVKDEISISD